MKLEMPEFQKAKLLVVGDIMLDRYWHGSASRVSPEAPVPVVCVDSREGRPGGAGNVALNISALGSAARLIGVVGKDETGRSYNLNCKQQEFTAISTGLKINQQSQSYA